MVNANTRRFFVSDNPAIFIRLFLLTNQRQGEVESASFSFLGTQPYTSSHFFYYILQRVNPSPVPCTKSFILPNRWKIVATLSAGIPIPLSLT